MSSLTRYLDPRVIQQVRRLDLRARFIVEGFYAGWRRSTAQGLAVEFSEHRKYTPGDDPRTIDWNVFARTDRLFSRRYATETHLNCLLLVDASASMGPVGPAGAPPSPDGTKLDYAIHLAAALGYLVTRRQDAIGLGLIADGLREFLPPRSRRADLLHLLGALAGVRPQGHTGLEAGVTECLRRTPRRGVFVLLSDLLTDRREVMRALQQVRYRGHDLIVMHILDAGETRLPYAGPSWLEDPETGAVLEVDADQVRGAYLRGLAEWRGGLHEQLRALRADYVELDTAMPFDKALVEFLSCRRRRV